MIRRLLRVQIPAELNQRRLLGPDWAAWLDGLNRRCTELLREWELEQTGDPMSGFGSIVIPVRGSTGDAMLKVGFDGALETEHEHLALQAWAGDGAVLLLRADPARRALLLEPLERRDLSQEWDLHACEVVAGLYGRLHIPASPRLRPLTGFVQTWLNALESDAREVPVPRRLIDQTLSRGREFVADPASVGALIHGDLHYENVLASEREPWLAIDPQPMSGDPHFEVAPLLENRWAEMTGYLRDGIQRRFYTVVEAAGLDDERARDWVIVRMVLNAHWAFEDAARMRRDLTDDEHDTITRSIAVAKAVQR